MSIETSILLVVAFGLGWYLASIVTTHLMARTFHQILQDLGVTTEQLQKLKQGLDLPEETPVEAQETRVEITLERHGDMLYAYRRSDSQFLAQGTDQQALIDHLNHTFANGARLIIREADGAELLHKSHS